MIGKLLWSYSLLSFRAVEQLGRLGVLFLLEIVLVILVVVGVLFGGGLVADQLSLEVISQEGIAVGIFQELGVLLYFRQQILVSLELFAGLVPQGGSFDLN